MKYLLTLFTILTFVSVSFAQQQAANNRLFIIERSKNANVVCYDANMTKDGKIDKEKLPLIFMFLANSKPSLNCLGKSMMTWRKFSLSILFCIILDPTNHKLSIDLKFFKLCICERKYLFTNSFGFNKPIFNRRKAIG
jgi:hypothetical protein